MKIKEPFFKNVKTLAFIKYYEKNTILI